MMLLYIAVFAALAIAGGWAATRNRARDYDLTQVRADNVVMRQALLKVRARAMAGADADPELQVILDIIGPAVAGYLAASKLTERTHIEQ